MTGDRDLLNALERSDGGYDERWRSLRLPLRAPRYHTRLRGDMLVHPVRESADYALGLLDSRTGWRVVRATEMLWRLVEEQDTGHDSDTYGLWPWFFDEPLDRMESADRNWADFIGVRLVQVLLRHGDLLERREPELANLVRSALRHAARAIMRRDVKLTYTNIAVMGTYVTLMAGDLLRDDEIITYGRDRLQRLAAFTEEQGGFSEYNSPTYTCVAVCELTRMVRDFTRGDDRRLAGALLRCAWTEIAEHWHVASGQWAGPHSRAYSTFFAEGRDEELVVLQQGLRGRAPVAMRDVPVSLALWNLPLRCPDELVTYFVDGRSCREVRRDVLTGGVPVTASTRLRPEYCVGAVSYGTLWEQAHPLIAYAPGRPQPVAFRPRLLFDGRDLASGRIFTVVDGDVVLVGITCATDVGAAHPTLDRAHIGRVRAQDLRIRLELPHVVPGNLPVRAGLDDVIHVGFGVSSKLALRLLDVECRGTTPEVVTGVTEHGACIDVVLHEGRERLFSFESGDRVFVAFALGIVGGEHEPPDLLRLSHHRDERSGELTIEMPDTGNRVRFPMMPKTHVELSAWPSQR